MKKLVQQYIPPGSKILVHATHPAYGETVGNLIQAAVRPIMRSPDQGALCILWAAVSPEARDNKYSNGTYFDDPAHEGGETKEASDQEASRERWKKLLSHDRVH
ncbi:hypothetical protein C6P46_001826 [Rhodotorula mucilaginosa]|uniref:Uncharacterized protein n=1 Tax=Rhodotorula mucilaginosa TaxID=5537 RepID=A0A9P6VSG8_RHOMI|nr:hypothetical protein C6P46_001826 [Rhodotorula mucilaginosa]